MCTFQTSHLNWTFELSAIVLTTLFHGGLAALRLAFTANHNTRFALSVNRFNLLWWKSKWSSVRRIKINCTLHCRTLPALVQRNLYRISITVNSLLADTSLLRTPRWYGRTGAEVPGIYKATGRKIDTWYGDSVGLEKSLLHCNESFPIS